MATPTNAVRAAERGKPRRLILRTMGGEWSEALRADIDHEASVDTNWPAGPGTRYHDRPDLFAAEVLGLTLMPHQAEILMAIERRMFTVVSSGRKTGKSLIAIIAALWWYCTRDRACVLMTATAAHQVKRVLWKELRWRLKKAPIKIRGQLNLDPCNGFGDDFRTIHGFSVSDREAAAGTSGTQILYVIDESSGVPDELFETLEGNMAAGGQNKLYSISNPTQNEGWHFKAFHPTGVVMGPAPRHAVNEKLDTETFTISSLDVARADGGKTEGLAGLAYCERQLYRHGPESAEYVVHVLGRHATNDEGRAFSLGLVTKAKALWPDMIPDEHAPLVIGLDPAGDNEITSDLSCFSVRRGAKILEIDPLRRGSDVDDILEGLSRLLSKHKAYERERVYVVFDVGGDIGARVLAALREVEKEWNFYLVPVRSSDVAVRHLDAAARRSAELVWNFRRFLKSGGAMPDDDKLTEECRAWEFTRVAHDSEQVKVNKEEVRKRIGRSPDRFDAVALSAWDVTDHEVRRAQPRNNQPWPHQQSRPASPDRGRVPPRNSSTNHAGLDPFSRRASRL